MELKSKLVITVLTGALAISGIASTQANGPLNNMIRHAALIKMRYLLQELLVMVNLCQIQLQN